MYCKQYIFKNKAKISAYYKQWKLDNKAKISASIDKTKRATYNKQYRAYNKTKLQEYCKHKYQTDLFYRIKSKLRSMVSCAFKRISKNKPARTEQLLGCSWIEAKAHFERLFKEGMTWKNHGEWHIDHIKPVAAFKENELHLMNHINNLQPLWAEENLGSKKVSDMVKWSL